MWKDSEKTSSSQIKNKKKNTKWEDFVKSRKLKADLYLLNQVDTCGSLSSHLIQRGSLRNEVTHIGDVDAHFKGACKQIRKSIRLVGRLAESLLGSFPRVPVTLTGSGPDAGTTVLVLPATSSSCDECCCHFPHPTPERWRFLLWTNESAVFTNYFPSPKASYLGVNSWLHLQKTGRVGNKLILPGYEQWVGSLTYKALFLEALLFTGLPIPPLDPSLSPSAVMLPNMHLVTSLLSSLSMHGLASTDIGSLAAHLSHTVEAVATTTFLLWMHPSYFIPFRSLSGWFFFAMLGLSQQDLQSATSLPKKGLLKENLQARRGFSVLSLLVCLKPIVYPMILIVVCPQNAHSCQVS